MTIDRNPEIVETSLTRDVLGAARYYLGGRSGLIAVAAVALGLGAYLGWDWLVAAGVAPLLLAVLPCAAMCALGLCMGGGLKRRSGDEASSGSSEGDQGINHSVHQAASPDGEEPPDRTQAPRKDRC